MQWIAPDRWVRVQSTPMSLPSGPHPYWSTQRRIRHLFLGSSDRGRVSCPIPPRIVDYRTSSAWADDSDAPIRPRNQRRSTPRHVGADPLACPSQLAAPQLVRPRPRHEHSFPGGAVPLSRRRPRSGAPLASRGPRRPAAAVSTPPRHRHPVRAQPSLMRRAERSASTRGRWRSRRGLSKAPPICDTNPALSRGSPGLPPAQDPDRLASTRGPGPPFVVMTPPRPAAFELPFGDDHPCRPP